MSTSPSPASGWFRTVQEAMALIEMQRPDAAIAALTPLLADPQADAAAIQRLIAYAHVRAQRFEPAVRHAHASIGLEPGRYEPYAVLAQAELGLHHAHQAADAAAQAVRLAPEAAWGYQLSALALTDLRRHEEAQTAGRQAVALAPEDADSHVALGYALRPVSTQAATRAYEQALALDPHCVAAQINLAAMSSGQSHAHRTTPAMVRLMAEHPSAQWPTLILQDGVLRIARTAWVMVLPFWMWVICLVLLGRLPVLALIIALGAGPIITGASWYRLGPWRRAMPTGLRRFLLDMWRSLPIVAGLVVSTVACWLSTVAVAVVNLVGSPGAVRSAVAASAVVGVATFIILHVLQRATLPIIEARTKAAM